MAKKKNNIFSNIFNRIAKTVRRTSKKAVSQSRAKPVSRTGSSNNTSNRRSYTEGQYGQLVKNSRLRQNRINKENKRKQEQRRQEQRKAYLEYRQSQKKYQNKNKNRVAATYGEFNEKTQRKSIPVNRKKSESRLDNLTKGNVKQIVGGHKTSFSSIRNPNESAFERSEEYRKRNEKNNSRFSDGQYGQLLKKERSGMRKQREEDLKKASKLIDEGSKDIKKGKEGLGKVGKFAADVYGAGIGLGADMLAGPASLLAAGSRSYGNAYKTAKDEGATDGQAALYGLAKGSVEAGTEKMFAVATPLKKLYGKGVGDDISERVLNKIVEKTKSKAGKEIAYNTGKVTMSALTEGLEEMVAEGLDPVIANNIYAKAVGKPHSTSAKDILYSGAVGAAMGGIMGGGGQIVDSSRGKRISDNAYEIFGDEGILGLVKKGLEADEDLGTQRRAAAYKKQIEEGHGIANGQVAELAREVGTQQERDRNRFDIMTKSADSLIKKNGYAPVINMAIDDTGNPVTVLSENTQKVFDERKAENENVINDTLGKELQLPQKQTSRIASSISAIQTGVANIDDISLFNIQNPEARTAYAAITGEKLPETNKDTKQHLFELTAKNKVDSAQAETEWFKDSVKGLVQQDMTSDYAASGQKALGDMAEHMNVVNPAELNSFVATFDDYYNAGRGGLSFSDVTSVKNPLHDVMLREDRAAAFEAGVRDREIEQDTVSGMQVKIGEAMKEIGSKGKTAAHRGRLISELSKETRKSLKSSQQSFFRNMARVFNIDIHIVDDKNMNGIYDNGVMYLSVDADRDLTYVFAHEITHHMQDYAPEEYLKFKNLIRDNWTKQGGINEAIRAKKAQYAEHGKKLSQDEALDEIVSDATYEMIQDENFIEEVCRGDRNIAQAILDAIRDILGKIRKILADGDRFTPNQNEALLSNLDILKDAERLWVDGLEKAVENRAAVGNIENSQQAKYSKRKPFDEQIDDVVQKKHNPRLDLWVMDTPKPLIDAGLSNGPLLMRNGKVEDILQKHTEMSVELLKKIPEAIENPIVIVRSKTHPTESVVVISEISTTKGDMVVPIWVNQEGAYVDAEGIEQLVATNFAASAYGRNVKNLLEYAMTHEGVLYKSEDNKKVEQLFARNGLQLSTPLKLFNFNNSIPENSENDKKFSLPDTDSVGNSLTDAQRGYFKNSKVVDFEGRLLNMHHGTVADEFYVFDKDKANPEGDSGAGFYFTNNDLDADENYSTESGADIENKIERRAEQIEAESDIDYEEAKDRARSELVKDSRRYDVYLNVTNPVYVGTAYGNETRILDVEEYETTEIEDDYDSYEEYQEAAEEEIQNAFSDDIDSAAYAAGNISSTYEETSESVREILYSALYDGGITFNELKERCNERYFENDNGDLIGNEIARTIVETLGYDGIIDSSVSDKFGVTSGRTKTMRGVDENTTHVIVFDSNQIKNVNNTNPTDDPDIRFSLKNKNITPNTRIPYVEHTSYITVNKNDYKALKTLQDKVRNLKRGTYENKATGYRADINGRTIGKIINPSKNFNPWSKKQNYIGNLNAAMYLPELFQNAVYVDTKGNQKKSNGENFHHFVAPIYMDNATHRVMITARSGKKYDLLYVVRVELLPNKKGAQVAGQTTSTSIGSPSDISIPQLVNGVKIYNYNTQKDDVYTHADIRYSVKESTAITYDSLVSKPDMKIVNMSKYHVGDGRRGVVNDARADIKMAGKVENGQYIVHNKDVNRDIIVGRNALLHGLTRHYENNAQVTVHIGEYLKNAVKINELIPRDDNVKEAYILLGYGQVAEDSYPAYFVVNTYENGNVELDDFDALYSANAKKIEGSALSSQGFDTSLPSTISISDLLDIVNEMYSDILPKSVAEHYGNERRKTKLGESVRYSLPDESDVYEYISENETEFVDVPPVRNYEINAEVAKDKTYAELRSNIENLKKEKKLTHGKRLDTKSVKEEVNNLVVMLKSYGDATGKKTDLKLVRQIIENISHIYTYLKEKDYPGAVNRAYRTAEDVIENLNLINDEMYVYYKELGDYLRRTGITLSEEDSSNIPDFKEWKKEQFGRLKIVKDGGIAVDDMYGALCERYPELFSEEITHPADQLMEIADVRQSLEPYDIMLSSEEKQQLVKQTAQDLIDIAVTGKPYRTWADRKKESYEDRLKALKARHKEAERDIKNRERDRAERMVKAEKSKAKKKEIKRKDEAVRKEYMASIEKNRKWLADRLKNPTDDKHIPEDFKAAVANLLSQIDMQSKKSKKLEKKRGKRAKRWAEMDELKARFAEIAKEDGSGIFEYDGYVLEIMESLAKKMNGRAVDEAEAQQLKEFDLLMKSIVTNIRNYNKAFSDDIKENISQIAESAMDAANTYKSKIKNRGKKYEDGKHYDRTGAIGAIDKMLNESMVTPRDFFERLGGGMNTVFKGMRKGFDKHVDNVTDARKMFDELFKPYVNKSRAFKRTKPGSVIEKWRDDSMAQTFTVEGGKITLNPAQIMSLYCLAKRAQAQGHMLGSGIVASDMDVGSKVKKAVGAKVESKGTAVRVSINDIYNIAESLTSQQREMADRLQDYLNNECAEWGNEVSLKLYGYKKFTEKNYFPIKSADTYLDKDINARTATEKIKNFGFTKGTVVNANNPIMIDDIFSVVADHINKMSLYNAFAAPISDFMRVYNYKGRDEAGVADGSVNSALKDAYGEKVTRYINNFMSDVNNQVQTRTEGFTRFLTKSLANYKKAVIGGNMRVALQQPTAIMRAFMIMSPKYFMGGNVNVRKNLKDMKEHCQIARWKSWGFSQVDMARDMDDIMMNREWSRIDAVTMELYGGLDNVTWSYIWAAVRKETKKKYPDVKVDSPEFYELCNERASEVFDKTQVVDSIFHKSQVMRNTDTMSKMVTSFMAEPTRTYNMVRSELVSARDLWNNGEKGSAVAKANRALSVFVLNAAAVSAAAAVADALRGKAPDDEDDDASWYANFVANFWNNVNPASMIPVVSDLWGVKDGWGVKNMALEGWESLIKSSMAFSNEPSGENLKKLAEGIGFVTGIPVKNALREAGSIFKILGIEVSAAEEGEDTEEKSKKGVLEKLLDGLKKDLGITDSVDEGRGPSGHDKGDKEYYGIYAEGAASLWDKITGKSNEEIEKRKFNKRIEDIKADAEGLSGTEREEAIWKAVTANYTNYVKDGEFGVIAEMRKTYEALDGDMDKFDKSIKDKVVGAIKKNVGEDGDLEKISEYKEYLAENYGYTDFQISHEILKTSETAKELKKAMAFDDWEAAKVHLGYLKDAGLTYEDFVLLYEERFKYLDGDEYTTGEFIVPTTGRISSEFGYRNPVTGSDSGNHKGIDIAAPTGTTVAAADGGKVVYAGSNRYLGHYVDIMHGNGVVTRYQHLDSYGVQRGQVVKKGQKIAEVGATGDVTGPHLHLEVRLGYSSAIKNPGTPVNPRDYFNF